MNRRIWAVLIAVMVMGILLRVALGVADEGASQEGPGEPSPETEHFIELKFERLTVIEALDPSRAGLSHFEVLSLPVVQVRPGQSIQSTWSGPRAGDMLMVQIQCTPSVSDDDQILLKDLEIKIIHTLSVQVQGQAVPVATGTEMGTTVKLTPGKPLILGGQEAKVQKHGRTLTQVEKWQVTGYWPVTLFKP